MEKQKYYITTPIYYPSGNMLQQVGRRCHLSGHYIIYKCIIYRILQVVTLHCCGHVHIATEIYDEVVADHLLTLKTAVVGTELHAFKFYSSDIVRFLHSLCSVEMTVNVCSVEMTFYTYSVK